MDSNPISNDDNGDANSSNPNNTIEDNSNLTLENHGLPGLGTGGRPGDRLQLTSNYQPIDTEGSDLLPYQVFLLQTADGPTLQRYKDKIILAYGKGLRYLEASDDEIVNFTRQQMERGEEEGLRQMARELHKLFRGMFGMGMGYDVQCLQNAAFMGGKL